MGLMTHDLHSNQQGYHPGASMCPLTVCTRTRGSIAPDAATAVRVGRPPLSCAPHTVCTRTHSHTCTHVVHSIHNVQDRVRVLDRRRHHNLQVGERMMINDNAQSPTRPGHKEFS